MTDFVTVDITTDPGAMVDTALDRIAAAIPGYVAQDGNLEVIQLNTIAPMAADAATVAATLIPAAFRATGTKLFNVPYEGSASATVQSTWTIVGAPGDPIPAGTYLTINDQGFYVQADTPVATGNSTITGVTLVAVDSGTSYNNLAGPPILSEQIDWVTTVAQTGLTSGGADPEDDDSYQNRLAANLRLQAPRPITASDYPPFVLSVPSTIVPAGVVVGRATAIDGYNPTATATFTANTTNGSASLTSASSIAALGPGTKLSGTGIQANTTVLSAASMSVVMDKTATATNSTVTITATGTYSNPRVVTTFVTDPSGIALSGPTMTAISTWLASFREANFLTPVLAPSYTTIYITYSVHALPGFDTPTLISNINSALTLYLNPQMWGNPSLATGGSNVWLNGAAGFNTIRVNKLIGIVENVTGVDYVPPGGLTLGTAPSPVGTSDIVLSGPAPLPQTNLTTPTIIGSPI